MQISRGEHLRQIVKANEQGVPKDVAAQRSYYEQTADRYDDLHVETLDEHGFAMQFMQSLCRMYQCRSILDVGAGTGRVARFMKEVDSELVVMSLEPVHALREVALQAGLSAERVTDGDATCLNFPDASFDMVCAFGVLHHIPNPERAVAEMLRVARRGIFISDANKYGQGSLTLRTLKQALRLLRLTEVADYIRTGGRRHIYSEEDGLAYPYSLYDNFRQISEVCDVFTVNTKPAGPSLYRSASHVALFGLKKADQ